MKEKKIQGANYRKQMKLQIMTRIWMDHKDGKKGSKREEGTTEERRATEKKISDLLR